MNDDIWLDALTRELHRLGLDQNLTRHVTAEAATHLHDSGQPPLYVFGTPEAYAAAVADSIGSRHPGPPRRESGTVRLDVRGVSKRYGRRTVLDSVDLTVRAGEVAAVAAPTAAARVRFCGSAPG
ncbi:MAG TPA: hypothetical protein VFX61_06285 [Micromonosporaceae bacterium]|nr:hypothetical protein [Micromonosporaceae bacterium]